MRGAELTGEKKKGGAVFEKNRTLQLGTEHCKNWWYGLQVLDIASTINPLKIHVIWNFIKHPGASSIIFYQTTDLNSCITFGCFHNRFLDDIIPLIWLACRSGGLAHPMSNRCSAGVISWISEALRVDWVWEGKEDLWGGLKGGLCGGLQPLCSFYQFPRFLWISGFFLVTSIIIIIRTF